MKTNKIYPNIVISSQTTTDGYYKDVDTNSSSDSDTNSSSHSTPRYINSPLPEIKQRKSVSPISDISSKRQELIRAQSMIQSDIRGSINNIDCKIQEKNIKHERDISKLEQRKIRLIKEYNIGVLDKNNRIRGTTPPKDEEKQHKKEFLQNDNNSLAHVTIDHAKKIIELEKELETRRKEKFYSLCTIL